ncbi:phage tail protein [uncultured Brachyspira sp.]|uniref:phage tail protein n=1 Tax=uncultured Brachyspira sp. TaxID=221953 RepID=UPI002631FB10|nr:phage tail protein [uncultured Brachyspira sp.]
MLNENNIQAPFQYKISENSFELLTRNGEIYLNTNNVQVKVFEGQRVFCADIGYAVDGALEEMEFLIDDIKVYPVLLEELKDLQSMEVKENEIYLIKNDINFKSIIFFPPIDLNKNFKYTITTYSSTFSSFMFDEIAKKLNIIDMNIPIKNYYEDTDYKINDVIKYNGYLYRVFREFTSDGTDYYLHSNCNLITPFKKLELGIQYKINDLAEYNNNFFTVQKGFTYEASSNLNELLKPIEDFIEWNDEIKKVYKNQIILKDNFCYLVLQTSENYLFDELIQFKRIDYLNKASNTFYDDENSNLGNETNTVQKAIEKLNNTKQNNLISGSNINIDGNTINVNGGVSKDYSIGSGYLTNDLIIYDNRLYIVNENFISSDWQTDKNKLTLLTSSGSLSTASQVAYDNNKTNLEYASGYSFPKFKYTIPDTINLVLTEASSTTDYTAAITKQSDGSYVLNANITNFNSLYTQKSIAIQIKSIENKTASLEILSIMNIFWNTNNTEWIANNGDVSIEGIEASLQFSFSGVGILISKTDLSDFTEEPYNITLSIKNRQLHNLDAYFLGIGSDANYLSYLNLKNNNYSVKLAGTINGTGSSSSATTSSYSFLSTFLSNYFNLASSGSYTNTTEITSSTGKAVKYYFMQNASDTNAVDLVIAYQDGSTISNDDIFTLNLTPDLNATVDPIYSSVENVQ